MVIPIFVFGGKSKSSLEEIQSEARALSTHIFEDRDKLKAILQRHEDTIRKRWAKKSLAKRTEILKNASKSSGRINPAAPPRPFIEALRRHTGNIFKKAGDQLDSVPEIQKADDQPDSVPETKELDLVPQREEAFLLPFINLEDLAKPKPLLIFLHSRGYNEPHVFVDSDIDPHHAMRPFVPDIPNFLWGYTMLFAGRTSPQTYGELVSPTDDADAARARESGVGKNLNPGHGMLVLIIQDRIWSFLVRCCELILHDVSSGAIQSSLDSVSAQKEKYTLLEIEVLERPYRTPSQLDWSRLKALISAERNAREDRLFALREDPEFFAETMREYKRYRVENLSDALGKRDTRVSRTRRWEYVMGYVTEEAYQLFEFFDELLRQLSDLHKMATNYADRIDPLQRLPEDYKLAFQNFRYVLTFFTESLTSKIKFWVLTSPPMREFVVRKPATGSATGVENPYYYSQNGTEASNHLMETLDMFSDDDLISSVGFHGVLNELFHLIENEASVSALISPPVAAQLSTVSLLCECLLQLHLYRPWARFIERDVRFQVGTIYDTVYGGILKRWSPTRDTKYSKSKLQILVDPTDDKFALPVNRHKTEENTDALRKAEANLTKVWYMLDSWHVDQSRSFHQLLPRLRYKNRRVQRTPDWLQSMSAEKRKKPYDIPFSPRYGPAADKRKHRAKSKLPILVDTRALKVFRALFHPLLSNTHPPVITWDDFVHGMIEAGFAAEKLHFSAWIFTPPKPFGVNRSIQFHQPPGDMRTRLSRDCATRFGRTLTAMYDWTIETFALREKESQGFQG